MSASVRVSKRAGGGHRRNSVSCRRRWHRRHTRAAPGRARKARDSTGTSARPSYSWSSVVAHAATSRLTTLCSSTSGAPGLRDRTRRPGADEDVGLFARGPRQKARQARRREPVMRNLVAKRLDDVGDGGPADQDDRPTGSRAPAAARSCRGGRGPAGDAGLQADHLRHRQRYARRARPMPGQLLSGGGASGELGAGPRDGEARPAHVQRVRSGLREVGQHQQARMGQDRTIHRGAARARRAPMIR